MLKKRKIPEAAGEVEALGIIREGSRARVWIEEEMKVLLMERERSGGRIGQVPEFARQLSIPI